MRPKEVKLGGKVLEHCLSADFEVSTPVDGRGHHEGHTRAMEIVLTRKADEKPSILGFKHGTNEDGRYVETTLDVTLQNAARKDAITVNCKKVIVSGYRITSPEFQGVPPVEEIKFSAGEVEYSAGGSKAKFSLLDWGPQE